MDTRCGNSNDLAARFSLTASSGETTLMAGRESLDTRFALLGKSAHPTSEKAARNAAVPKD